MRETLRPNNSKNAGCMRRSPASHCCQTRHVECRSLAAAVWVRPAASRAARMAAGVGFDAGPFGPRFGWLVMSVINFNFTDAIGRNRKCLATAANGVKLTHLDSRVGTIGHCFFGLLTPRIHCALIDSAECAEVIIFRCAQNPRSQILDTAIIYQFDCAHFVSPAPEPEARWNRRSHKSKYTRNARNVKGFFENNFEGQFRAF